MTKSVDPKAELKALKKDLAQTKARLKEIEAANARLRQVVGGDALQGWTPQERIERQYGWVYAWMYPLDAYINPRLEQPLSADMRNQIRAIVMGIIAQLAVAGRYGVQLPHDARVVDIKTYFAKQADAKDLNYPPCAICGETRITHECHILPRAEGGPLHADNFVYLCPLHHHLFDHSRLSPSEWERLIQVIDQKMDSAKAYAHAVRLAGHQAFWMREEQHTPPSPVSG